jgi:hypothetical protein
MAIHELAQALKRARTIGISVQPLEVGEDGG